MIVGDLKFGNRRHNSAFNPIRSLISHSGIVPVVDSALIDLDRQQNKTTNGDRWLKRTAPSSSFIEKAGIPHSIRISFTHLFIYRLEFETSLPEANLCLWYFRQ